MVNRYKLPAIKEVSPEAEMYKKKKTPNKNKMIYQCNNQEITIVNVLVFISVSIINLALQFAHRQFICFMGKSHVVVVIQPLPLIGAVREVYLICIFGYCEP